MVKQTFVKTLSCISENRIAGKLFVAVFSLMLAIVHRRETERCSAAPESLEPLA
jgi:hypothetical protein